MKRRKKLVITLIVIGIVFVLFSPISVITMKYRMNVVQSLIDEMEINYPIYKEEYLSGKVTSEQYIGQMKEKYAQYDGQSIGSVNITYNDLIKDVVNDTPKFEQDIIEILNEKSEVEKVEVFLNEVVKDIQGYAMIKYHEQSEIGEITNNYKNISYAIKVIEEMENKSYEKIKDIVVNYSGITVTYDGKIRSNIKEKITSMYVYTDIDRIIEASEKHILPIPIREVIYKEYQEGYENMMRALNALDFESEEGKGYSSYKATYVAYIEVYELDKAGLLEGFDEVNIKKEYDEWMLEDTKYKDEEGNTIKRYNKIQSVLVSVRTKVGL